MEISTHNGPPSLRYAGAYGDDHDRNLQSLARGDIQVGYVGIKYPTNGWSIQKPVLGSLMIRSERIFVLTIVGCYPPGFVPWSLEGQASRLALIITSE